MLWKSDSGWKNVFLDLHSPIFHIFSNPQTLSPAWGSAGQRAGVAVSPPQDGQETQAPRETSLYAVAEPTELDPLTSSGSFPK